TPRPRGAPKAAISESAISVTVHPGQTTLARSPWWAWSTASDWVSIASPALVTAYPPISAEARSAATDATDTTAPRARSKVSRYTTTSANPPNVDPQANSEK